VANFNGEPVAKLADMDLRHEKVKFPELLGKIAGSTYQ